MTEAHEARITTDHGEVRRWVDAREGRPAMLRDTGDDGEDVIMLRISFRDDPALKVIDWDEFFETFEDEDLAFLYQEQTRDGKRSRFCKFVDRA